MGTHGRLHRVLEPRDRRRRRSVATRTAGRDFQTTGWADRSWWTKRKDRRYSGVAPDGPGGQTGENGAATRGETGSAPYPTRALLIATMTTNPPADQSSQDVQEPYDWLCLCDRLESEARNPPVPGPSNDEPSWAAIVAIPRSAADGPGLALAPLSPAHSA